MTARITIVLSSLVPCLTRSHWAESTARFAARRDGSTNLMPWREVSDEENGNTRWGACTYFQATTRSLSTPNPITTHTVSCTHHTTSVHGPWHSLRPHTVKHTLTYTSGPGSGSFAPVLVLHGEWITRAGASPSFSSCLAPSTQPWHHSNFAPTSICIAPHTPSHITHHETVLQSQSGCGLRPSKPSAHRDAHAGGPSCVLYTHQMLNKCTAEVLERRKYRHTA